MGTNGQEDNRSISMTIAKAVFTFWHRAALFADNENKAKVAVNTNTAAANEVQPTWCIS